MLSMQLVFAARSCTIVHVRKSGQPFRSLQMCIRDRVRILEKGEGVEKEFLEAGKRRVEVGYEVSNEEMKLYGVSEVVKEMNRYCSVGFFTLPMKAKGFEVRGSYDLQTKSVNPYNRSFELLTQDLKRLKRNGYRVVLLSGSRTRARRLAEDLRDYDLSSYYSCLLYTSRGV